MGGVVAEGRDAAEEVVGLVEDGVRLGVAFAEQVVNLHDGKPVAKIVVGHKIVFLKNFVDKSAKGHLANLVGAD